MRAIVASLVIAGSLAASAMPAHAQRGSGWAAYLGCWAPGEPDRSELAAPTPAVMRCIVPGSADDRVLMLTVQKGNVLDRQEVVADGAERAVDRDGCRGTERATWTGGGARLLVRGELACAAGASGSTTAILDVVSGSAWLQVAGIRSGNNVDARPQWYRRVQPDSTWPASVIVALTNTGKATQIARVAAVSDPDLSEIERLATTADEAVVRAWLVSREAAGRRPIPIDGKALVRLARAGVGGVVTDVLVALANPDAFELSDGGARPTTAGATNFASDDRRHRRMGYSWMNDPMCDGPWNASSWMFYNPMYGGFFPSTGYDSCNAYGYAPYGRGWSLGLAYGYPFGSPYLGYGGGWFWRPVGSISPVPRATDTRATLSKNGGYAPRGGGQDQGRTASGTSGNTGGSTANSTGAASAPAPASGGGRTAVKKP